MLHFMRDMREISSRRFQFLNVLQRFFQPQMSFVWTDAQAIEHQHFQIAKAFNRRWRNLTQISCIRKIIETIRDHRQPSVNYFQRSDFQIVPDAKRRAIHNCMRDDLREPTAEMRRLEDILKDAANVFPRALVRVQPESAMPKIQRANVVETKDMIGVTVCNENCVKVSQANLQSLLAKVARSVDDNRLAGVLDQNGNAQSLITRII